MNWRNTSETSLGFVELVVILWILDVTMWFLLILIETSLFLFLLLILIFWFSSALIFMFSSDIVLLLVIIMSDCIPGCLSRCKILVLLVAKFYQDKTRILEYFTSCKMWNMFLKLVKLTIKLCKINYKVNKRHRWRRSGPFIIKFEHIPLLFTVFLLLTLIS